MHSPLLPSNLPTPKCNALAETAEELSLPLHQATARSLREPAPPPRRPSHARTYLSRHGAARPEQGEQQQRRQAAGAAHAGHPRARRCLRGVPRSSARGSRTLPPSCPRLLVWGLLLRTRLGAPSALGWGHGPGRGRSCHPLLPSPLTPASPASGRAGGRRPSVRPQRAWSDRGAGGFPAWELR